MEDPLEEFRVVEYKVGTKWYCIEQFMYITQKKRNTSIILRCADSDCPARWLYQLGRGRFKTQAPVPNHNHQPHEWYEQRNTMFQKLRDRSTNEVLPLLQIYEEEAVLHPIGAVHLPFERVHSSMRDWRRGHQPPIPRTIDAYAMALAENERFAGVLVGHVRTAGGSSVILGMPDFIRCLQDAQTILADATFDVVPAGLPATQLLTIHAVCQAHNFHPIVALMTHRRRELYDATLNFIWQAAGHPQPETVMADYEPALQGALQAVSPRSRIQGCFFHFTQALIRRARALGLVVARDSEGWQLVRLFIGLATLPPHFIPAALAEIPAIAQNCRIAYVPEFMDYFQNFWMAQIGPERFSVCGAAHRTTNIAESFHAELGRALRRHPNVWEFTAVVHRKLNCSGTRFTTHQRQGGLGEARGTAQNLIRSRDLRQSLNALNGGNLTLQQYLLRVGRIIRLQEVNNPVEVPEIGAEIEIEVEVAAEVVNNNLHEQVPPPPPNVFNNRFLPLPAPPAPAPPVPAPPAPAPPAPAPQTPAAPPAPAPSAPAARSPPSAIVPISPTRAPAPAPFSPPPHASRNLVPFSPPSAPVPLPQDFHPESITDHSTLQTAVPSFAQSHQAIICRVCYEQLPAVAFECGHIVCQSCADRLGNTDLEIFICPFCRAQSLNLLRIYI